MSWSLKHGKTTSVPIRLDFAKNTSALWRVEKPDCEMMGEWKPSLNCHVLQQTLKTVPCPIPTYPRRRWVWTQLSTSRETRATCVADFLVPP